MPTWFPKKGPGGSEGKKAAGAESALADRRREVRVPAEGEVILAPETPRPMMITARLLDLSPNGFRAAHASPTLETGSVLHFRHGADSGRAKVVWNRSSGGNWESGFLIVR